ncbi:MAG: formate acetyltransferase [Geobacteraceae bacterium]|nr:formate acetyltransferase [Geobacteraceae bacterium]
MATSLPATMTDRTKALLEALRRQGLKNRADEWFRDSMFPDIGKEHPEEPVIVRSSLAIRAMLRAMANEENSVHTKSYEIPDGELIVGVLAMGSNGLGKMFPNYLTEAETRAARITNRTEMSLLGHNSADYGRLVKKGIRGVLEICDRKSREAHARIEAKRGERDDPTRLEFYRAVRIACEAVVEYAGRFADLAKKKAGVETDPTRRGELLEIERICRKVPMEPADTFHEALQSIWFVHTALHAGMNLISIGRLDQVLAPYVHSTVKKEVYDPAKAVELVECFLIKAAWRLNFTTEYLLEQDHVDYGVNLGVNPSYLDQRGGANNFLQNIIIGGLKPDGSDATCDSTYIILQAFRNVNLPTPGLYVRMRKESPEELKRTVAASLHQTRNNPCILNDDVVIPALYAAFCEGENPADAARLATLKELVNDYCVDGCWEPVLNGKSNWTFGMINGMTIMECALNRGATLSSNPGLLRGGKLSYRSGEIACFDDLLESLRGHLQFFVDQSTFGLYKYYMIDEYVVPSPLLSAFLGSCLDRGRDKSWGGTEYNIGGTIITGVPNMVNTVCAVKKWVFDRKKYQLGDVLDAFRYNFVSPSQTDPFLQHRYDSIRVDFATDSPVFGNNDPEANAVTRRILDYYFEAVMNSKKLGDRIFVRKPADEKEEREVQRLRCITGYYGESFQEKFGSQFDIKFTAGCGTFELYPTFGQGVAASADRSAGDPLAPNFSPTPGTATRGIGNLLASFREMGLDRMAAGVITDICLDESQNDPVLIQGIIEQFIANGGNMMTLAIGNSAAYQTIYELSVAAAKMADRREAVRKLEEYADINVRVGGWHAPFVTMTLDQQENYINRPAKTGASK